MKCSSLILNSARQTEAFQTKTGTCAYFFYFFKLQMFLDDLYEMKGIVCIPPRTTTRLPDKLSPLTPLFTCKIFLLHFQVHIITEKI